MTKLITLLLHKPCLLLFFALILLPASVTAQEGFRVQQFEPALAGQNYITVHGSNVLPHLVYTGGIFFNYSDDPLKARQGDNILSTVVENQLGLDLVLGIGFFDLLELSLDLPIILYQESGDLRYVHRPGETLSKRALGDLRITPKITLLDSREDFVGLAFLVNLSLPTGSSEQLVGDGRLGLEPRVAIDYMLFSTIRLGLNVGFAFRNSTTLNNLDVGDELTFGLAGKINFTENLALLPEITGSMIVSGDSINSEEVPLEIGVALQYTFADDFVVTLGAGTGLNNGAGVPDFRVFTGLAYVPIATDPDGDGFRGSDDLCPMQKEDKDLWEDGDGCPEPDNDGDGLLDTEDECPNKAEDIDNWEDDDGCPDLDNDNDGFVDSTDNCPNESEDIDQFEDSDGCPDLDNDGDGFPDSEDQCVDLAEDVDQFKDDDGCPDTDNDDDGIPDEMDACRDEAEDYNQVDDEDGCPDSKVIVREGKIEILDKIYFEKNKNIILTDSYKILNDVAEVLSANKEIKKVMIIGYTSNDGSATYNKRLSGKRAKAVRDYMIQQGISAKRLGWEGKGEENPIADNATEEGREKNRRVEFVIVE